MRWGRARGALERVHTSVSPRHPHRRTRPLLRHTRACRGYLDATSTNTPASLLAMPREPCAYILASRPHGAIYFFGVTPDLPRRVWQHS